MIQERLSPRQGCQLTFQNEGDLETQNQKYGINYKEAVSTRKIVKLFIIVSSVISYS